MSLQTVLKLSFFGKILPPQSDRACGGSVKRKFKESVAISQEKKDNLFNKKEERKVISDIWNVIITQTKFN